MRFLLKFLRIKTYPHDKMFKIVADATTKTPQLVEWVKQGKCYIYAIRLFGRTIGRVFLLTDCKDKDRADGRNVCYLSHLWVHPKLRGNGLGTRLIKHVVKNAKKMGFKKITLSVNEKEDRNVRLYKRLGFTTLVKSRQTENSEYVFLKKYLTLMKDI